MKKISIIVIVQLGCLLHGFSQNGNNKEFYFDLEPIQAIDFENKKIVAIGEATHNSHEEAIVKNEIAKYLISKKGYRHILLEAYDESVVPLNSFIHNQSEVKNIKKWIFNNKQLYWIWKTEEFIDLLVWLKNYNTQNTHKVQILGVDNYAFKKGAANRDSLMANKAIKLVERNRNFKGILFAHNCHVFLSKQISIMPAGLYLNNYFNDEYYPIGIAFKEGSFNAVLQSKYLSMDTMTIESPLKGGIYKFLEKQGDPETMFFDLTRNTHHIFSKKSRLWVYGSTHKDKNTKSAIQAKLNECFSGVVYINKLSSASNLMMPGNYFAKIEKHFRVKDSSIRRVNAFVNLSRENNYDTSSINICIKTYNKNKLVTYKEAYVHPRFDSKAFQLETAIDGPIDLIIVSVLLIGEDEFKINSLEVNVEEEGKTKTIFVEDFRGERPPNLDYYTRTFSREIKNGSLIIKRKGNS